MKNSNRSLLLILLLCALPAWAHGENLAFYCGGIVHGLPALLLLFVPWHRGWVRLVTTVVMIAGAVVVWFVIIPRWAHANTPSLVQWLILLSPCMVAFALAAFLRIAVDRVKS